MTYDRSLRGATRPCRTPPLTWIGNTRISQSVASVFLVFYRDCEHTSASWYLCTVILTRKTTRPFAASPAPIDRPKLHEGPLNLSTISTRIIVNLGARKPAP